MFYQQGDVLLKSVASVPRQATKTESGTVVLAEGESTGHRHVVEAGAAVLVQLYILDHVRRYLEVKGGPATVRHDEHGPIQLPPGVYEIDQVPEWDHFSQKARFVAD